MNPLVASLASDLFPSERRGQVFGVVTAISAVGHIIGSVMTTDMSEKTILGIAGWRVAFYIIALASCLGALLVRRIARDPPRGISDGHYNSKKIDVDVAQTKRPTTQFVSFSDAISLIFRNKTFLAIVFQRNLGFRAMERICISYVLASVHGFLGRYGCQYQFLFCDRTSLGWSHRWSCG